jgi:uncharacterized protein (TIGR02466 family)
MMKITPMFCKPLIEVNIDIDINIDIEKIFLKFKHEAHTPFCKLTLDMNIINKPKFKRLKKVLNKVLKDVNEKVWKLDRELIMTTSWLTQTSTTGESKPHSHLNSMFSGVFYFQDSSPITFSHPRTNTIYHPPYENTVYNSERWTVSPKKHDLILFPSEIIHTIEANNNPQSRYSLAFNVLPIGVLGYKDSTITIGKEINPLQ